MQITDLNVTVDGFRAHFPELAAVPDTQVSFWLAVGDGMLPLSRWGTQHAFGVELFAAHNIYLQMQQQAAVSAGGAGGSAIRGPVTSESGGGLSVSYDTSSSLSASAGHWNLSIYGIQLWSLIRMRGAGPIQIGAGAPAIGMLTPFAGLGFPVGPGWGWPFDNS